MSHKAFDNTYSSQAYQALAIRWLFLLAIIVIEVMWIRFHFDFDTEKYGENVPWPAEFLELASSEFLGVIAAFIAVLLITLSPRFEAVLRDMREQIDHPWWLWLLLHGLTFGAFVFHTSVVFWPSAETTPTPSIELPLTWLLGWFGLGLSTAFFWLFAIAPLKFWLRLARQEYVNFLISVLAGFVSWASSPLFHAAWRPLAEITLLLAHRVLGLIYPNVVHDGPHALLGTPSFQVQIAPACSGFEGISLVSVFLAVYLWLFRKELRFPGALLLFPLGILVIWLANVVRIAALVIVGTSLSPEVAQAGFHSYAGWITFTLVALGLIGLSRRFKFFAITTAEPLSAQNISLAAALLIPLLAAMATTMLTAAFSNGFDALYPLRAIVTAAVLWHFGGVYKRMDWAWSWQALPIGVAIFLIWIFLEPEDSDGGANIAKGLAALPDWLAASWLVFRVIGSVITVPLAEELAFRGYLIRKLVAPDFENVRLGQFTWLSFILSSVLFGLLHGRWVAGTLAGMGFALALYRRGRIGDAVVAHMTANALIAAYVLIGGKWSLWS